jgi:lipopolysaccharide export system protein LptA
MQRRRSIDTTVTQWRLALGVMSAAAFFFFFNSTAAAQSTPPSASVDAPAPDDDEVIPALPPGISELDIEVFAAHAYTWTLEDGRRVIECRGEFELRMGGYTLRSEQAVLWFHRVPWRDRDYFEMEAFLWRQAEIRHPGGTIETGDALLPRLRSFGTLVLNADAHAAFDHSADEFYVTASRVRDGVEPLPTTSVEEESAEPLDSPLAAAMARRRKQPPPPVSYRSDSFKSIVRDGQRLVIVVGDVYVSQGSPHHGDFFELRADAAVLYMTPGLEDAMGGLGVFSGNASDEGGPESDEPPRDTPRNDNGGDEPPDILPTSPADETLRDEDRDDRETARRYVEAIYLEGDVIITRGDRTIRAARIYYDLRSNQALILDAVLRAFAQQRNLPIYVRAEEVRQLSITDYEARHATISTSEFHTPHVSIGAETVTLADVTPRDESGEIIGVRAGRYTAKNTTFRLDGFPLLWSPASSGDFQGEDTAFRSAKAGYDDEFGAAFQTQWHLFNLLGLVPPEGFDGTLKLDYFTQRGPGVGVDLDYEREDYYGLFRGYYINDHGTDDLSGNPQRGGDPDTENRGRVLWRHRQFLDQGWELTLETAYISDRNYLEEYERNEFENGKEQETGIYLVKRDRNWQFSTLFNENINHFITQTEHLPEARFSLLGEPIGDYATLYHDSRMGGVRYDLTGDANADFLPRNEQGSTNTARGDLREEMQFPLPALGPLKFTPFASIRGTHWDGSPRGSGGVTRAFSTVGVQGNMYFSRVYEDVDSRLLDVHRLRHIIKPDFNLWYADTNRNSNEMYRFDSEVEDIDAFGGGSVGLRQRWQTKRGSPGRWRTVDWIVLDVEAGFFDSPPPGDNTHGNVIDQRPEDSIASNFLSMNFLWRLSDTTALIYEGVYDWNRGEMGTSAISLAYERLPRLAAFLGWRFVDQTRNNVLAAGANYKLNEKHTIGIRELYDIDRGQNVDTSLVLIRRWPRWYTAVTIAWDRAIDDFSVNLSIWPEGAPNFGLGSKRYTDLGSTVGIRP